MSLVFLFYFLSFLFLYFRIFPKLPLTSLRAVFFLHLTFLAFPRIHFLSLRFLPLSSPLPLPCRPRPSLQPFTHSIHLHGLVPSKTCTSCLLANAPPLSPPPIPINSLTSHYLFSVTTQLCPLIKRSLFVPFISKLLIPTVYPIPLFFLIFL